MAECKKETFLKKTFEMLKKGRSHGTCKVQPNRLLVKNNPPDPTFHKTSHKPIKPFKLQIYASKYLLLITNLKSLTIPNNFLFGSQQNPPKKHPAIIQKQAINHPIISSQQLHKHSPKILSILSMLICHKKHKKI